MFKKIICLFLTIMLLFTFVGCAGSMDTVDDKDVSMFIKIESFRISNGGCSRVVFHRDTKVMYVISYDGIATVMVDSEGKPLLYKED